MTSERDWRCVVLALAPDASVLTRLPCLAYINVPLWTYCKIEYISKFASALRSSPCDSTAFFYKIHSQEYTKAVDMLILVNKHQITLLSYYESFVVQEQALNKLDAISVIGPCICSTDRSQQKVCWLCRTVLNAIFTARQHSLLRRALYTVVNPSVSLSVCLSITRWHWVKTTQATIMGSSLEDSPMTLVSSC